MRRQRCKLSSGTIKDYVLNVKTKLTDSCFRAILANGGSAKRSLRNGDDINQLTTILI